MANNNIKLAEFDLDLDKILEEAQKYKELLDELKDAATEMRKDGIEKSSKAYVANEARIRALNKEYRDRVRILGDAAQQQQQVLSVQERVTNALEREAVTIADLRASNRELNALRNTTDITTEEGQATLAKLNARLDENNDLIKENVEQYTKQKINIGNYKQDMKEALEETNAFTSAASGGFKGLFMTMTEAGGAGTFVKQGISAAARSVVSLTKASLAFIATPIGAIVAALAAVFFLVKHALDGNEEGVQALTIAFAPLRGIVTGLLNALKPLGEFLADVLVKTMEMVTVGIQKMMEGLSSALRFLGFETLANSVEKVNDAMAEGAETVRKLAEAEYDLVKMRRESEVATARLRRVSEEMKLIRDDEAKSLEERLDAARKVTEADEAMIQSKLDIIKKEIEINQLLQEEGNTGEEILNQRAKLLAQMEDLEGQQASLERRAQRRLQSIQKEVTRSEEEERQKRVDAANKAMDRKLDIMNQELAYFLESQGFREKTAQESLQFSQEVAEKEKEILKAQLQSNKISQLEYNTEILAIKNRLALEIAKQTSENAKKELDQFISDQQARINQVEYLTEALAEQLKTENENRLEAEREYQQQRLDLGLISEDEFNQIINEKKEQIRLDNQELDAERLENEKEEEELRRALEFENEIERMREEKETMFNIERELQNRFYDLQQEDLDNKLAQGLISQERYSLEATRIDRARADAMIDIKKSEEEAKMKLTAGLLDAVADLIDQDSKVGKSIALAKAGMNVFEAITKDLALGFPQNVIAIARDTAIGFKAVKDILSTNIPSAKGSGSVGGGGSTPSMPTVNGASIDDSATVLNQLDAQNQDTDIVEQTRDAVVSGSRQGIQEGMVDLTENRRVQAESQF